MSSMNILKKKNVFTLQSKYCAQFVEEWNGENSPQSFLSLILENIKRSIQGISNASRENIHITKQCSDYTLAIFEKI